MSAKLSTSQIDAIIALDGALGGGLLLQAAAELKKRRAIELLSRSSEAAHRLLSVKRMNPLGPRAMEYSDVGGHVSWHDYAAALDELLPYRDELLKLAVDYGCGDDPFALWEALARPKP